LILTFTISIDNLYAAAVQYLSQATPSDSFATLAYEEGHPDTYTVGCFDSSFIPPSELADLPARLGNLDPVKKWLHKNLIAKLQEERNVLVTCNEGLTSDNIRYYMVMYKKRLYRTAAENFSQKLMNERLSGASSRQAYHSSMLIFPYTAEHTQALVYLFGQWMHLHNPHALVKDWGLRIAAHKKMFTETGIKSITGKNDASANPTLRTVTKTRLDTLDSFDLEIGTEGLRTLRSLPQYTQDTDCVRLSKANDTFQIHLTDPDSKSSESVSTPTVDVLAAYAHYFYTLSHHMVIHRELRPYIDTEVTDEALITLLNAQLEQLLIDPSSRFRIFPHDWFWKTYGTPLQFRIDGDTYTKYLTQSWKGKTPRLDTTIYFKRPRQKGDDSSELLKHIIRTLPIEHDSNFYTFDRGHWNAIQASRFDAIKKKLRSSKIKQDIPELLPFTAADGTGQGGLYAEDAYNKRIVAACNATSGGPRALLLDRVNIFLQGAYDKFEFADIILCDDEERFSLIHVKRRTSNDIDHHRTQIERCADYLATELRKQRGEGIFFTSFITSLYVHHGLKPQKSQRTDSFKNASKKISSKRAWKEVLDELLARKGDDAEGTNELKELLKAHDLSVYENHRNHFVTLLDALRDCNKHTRLTKVQLATALEAAEQALAVHDNLLKALANSKQRKNIRIVMAVIDDRSIMNQQEGVGEQQGRNTELFHLQDLWGLDRTCGLVQKRGFSFVLSVVNERKDETRDAFGIFAEEKTELSSDDEREEEEVTQLDTQKQKATSRKRSHKEKSEESLGDENDGNEDDDYDNEMAEAISKKEATGSATAPTKKARHAPSEEDSHERGITHYQYSASDVARLLHLSLRDAAPDSEDYERYSLTGADIDDDADPMTVVHRWSNRYVLPPITQYTEGGRRQSSQQVCIDVLRQFFTDIAPHTPAITELIIPYNPGGHWITLHVRIRIDEQSHEKTGTLVYYESLRGLTFEKYPQMRAYLRSQGYQGLLDAYHRKGFIQPDGDGVSCGAITVKTITRLFAGEEIVQTELSDAECLTLKQDHRTLLQTADFDFDF
jgi:uncharacterized protein (TIGR04141 family)